MSDFSPQRILEELAKPRSLSWELEMLSCFPEDDAAIANEEWALLSRSIARHGAHFDLEILSKIENLKLIYNLHAKRCNREELELNLTVKPWQRPLGGAANFVERVVQELKYEDTVKEERKSAPKTPTSPPQQQQPREGSAGKRTRMEDVEDG
ncbi:hypothetical protein BASA81_007805 [Batrachochytrium salamandrivorans]|nr:hypothetical protein BASA81_007805 [Batrachochytrium salamandrivorans]